MKKTQGTALSMRLNKELWQEFRSVAGSRKGAKELNKLMQQYIDEKKQTDS